MKIATDNQRVVWDLKRSSSSATHALPKGSEENRFRPPIKCQVAFSIRKLKRFFTLVYAKKLAPTKIFSAFNDDDSQTSNNNIYLPSNRQPTRLSSNNPPWQQLQPHTMVVPGQGPALLGKHRHGGCGPQRCTHDRHSCSAQKSMTC